MTRRPARRLAVCVAAVLPAVLAAVSAEPLALVVDSESDQADQNPGDRVCDAGLGRCTLRAALEEANASIGPDTIHFNIPLLGRDVAVIRPQTTLPDMADHSGVVLDATTQPGYAGTPVVELDGSDLPAAHGLRATGGHAVIRGLSIHSFGSHGIILRGSHLNAVESCHIGVDPTGTLAQGNGVYGVFILDSADNVIGGTGVGRGNIISGNGDGVFISGGDAFGNLVAQNRIGTDVSGSLPLGNLLRGVVVSDAPGNTVGGADRARNVISGNGLSGVEVRGAGARDNRLPLNNVGVDTTGRLALGNLRGIVVDGAPGTVIGLPGGPGNLVSGNRDAGIVVTGSAAAGTEVIGNRIGVDSDGAPLGNLGDGLRFDDDASFSTVGGTGPGDGNVVAFNGGSGVVVASGRGDHITANRLYSNGGLGIDLGRDGTVTGNDPGDADVGGNDLHNYPELTAVAATCVDTSVDGRFAGAPGSTLAIELFASDGCDPSGHGEGELYLGSTAATTDGAGLATFSVLLPVRVLAGHAITATATDAAGNSSEFSSCFAPATTCALCGNSVLDPGEACDDGGVDTPLCDADCTASRCGDGHVNAAAGEECDDGNAVAGDGCSATCAAEGCAVAALGRVAGLVAVKQAGAVTLSWQPDPAAGEHHVNSVTGKAELADPRRTPGAGRPECDTGPGIGSCRDDDALTGPEPRLFYQALSACGPDGASEGPY